MTKTKEQLIARQREINETLSEMQSREMNDELKGQMDVLVREYNNNKREIEVLNMAEQAAPQQLSANEQMREAVKSVREHRVDGDFTLMRDSQNVITSGAIASGDLNNMVSAGIPLTIKELINPLEMGLIYDKLGIKVATGVRGNIQWPCLDSVVEATVGGELDDAGEKTLDFSKITASPVKLGISISVSNEAINDQAFDLVGTITSQMSKAFGRVLNARVLALSAPATKASFVGPLVSKAQSATFAGDYPTYAELKAAKGKVLATGAEMAGFCYIMDAAMYSALEAQPKDAGSGRFVIEGGKIDGDPIFLTNLAAYANKVVAGCFAYEALNQHGEVHFIVDPYTQAKKNVTVFTLNADFSLTNLVSGDKYPFVVVSKASAPTITGDAAVELAATATAVNRNYSTSNGAAVIVSNSASLPDWLQVAVASNGHKVTFTPTANSTGSARTFTVKLGIANETSNLDVVLTQAAAE